MIDKNKRNLITAEKNLTVKRRVLAINLKYV